MTAGTKENKFPYAIGDNVIYTDSNGKIHKVTLTMISWEGVDIARGEKPMIAVRMPDGRVRDTVIERISPIDKEISKKNHPKTHTNKKLTRQNALPASEWYTPPDMPGQVYPHLTKNLSVNVGHDGETSREVRLTTPRSKSPSKRRKSLSPSESLKLSMHSSKLKTQKRENARKIIKELREKQKQEIALLKKKKREEVREIVRKLREKQKKELLKITRI